MNVVGLDLSLTGTGICYNGDVSTIKPGTKLRDEARLDFIEQKIWQAFGTYPDLVAVEGLAYSSKTGKATERAGLWWIMKMGLWHNKVPVAVVAPTTRAKYATGKGNADKDTVMIEAVKRYTDQDIKNNNEADAVIIWAMALDQFETAPVAVPSLNRTALNSVVWPEIVR